MAKRLRILLCLPLVLAGCAARFTNLTPQQFQRNNNNLYPVEVAMKSRQQSLRWDSIQPCVVVGAASYPMRPVQLMTNRWETLVPVPPTSSVIHYRFKFDYQYNAISERKSDSAASPTYTLKILN